MDAPTAERELLNYLRERRVTLVKSGVRLMDAEVRFLNRHIDHLEHVVGEAPCQFARR